MQRSNSLQDHSKDADTISSGHIGDRVTFTSFSITVADRQSNKSGSSVTFAFWPSAGGSIPISGTITLHYPANFFLPSSAPVALTNASIKINCTSQSASFIVLTVQNGTVSASTALLVTLIGLTIGSATSSIPNSVSVTTSHDANTIGISTLASGPIGNRVKLLAFTVPLWDRVANKSGCSATLAFSPSVGGDIAVGGNITLNFPSGFFLTDPYPFISLSGSVSSILTSHTESSVILTVQSGAIAASTPATITLSGFRMGNVTAEIPNSISVTTTNDANTYDLSTLSSGHIGHRVHVNSFVIAPEDRIESKVGVALTLTFTPSVGGAIVAGGSLTLHYPQFFFAMTDVPEVPAFNCSAFGVYGVAVFVNHEQNWISVTTSGPGKIAASRPVIVTLSGLKLGPATKGHATGVTVSTSQDQVHSIPVDSGAIGARLNLHQFSIKIKDAVAGKLDSSATITFRTSIGGAIPSGGRIIVKYFALGFFGTAQIPQFSCSVPHVSGQCAFDVSNADYSAIVITTSGSGSIPGSAVVTITLSGLTIGGISDGGSVTVSSSADHESEPAITGRIYSRNDASFPPPFSFSVQ
jgi:hypothetical protein